MKVRTCAVVAALSLLPLVGCGDDDSDDNYKAKPSKAAGDNKASDVDKKKAAASKTEMKVGDTFRYHDGIKVTVTSIDKVTKFSEYDTKPSPAETAFRINIKFDNGGKNPVDLDDFSTFIEGATKGGEAAVTTWENGSAEITGRLAAGQTATKTEDGVLEKKYGTSMLVTLQRTTDDGTVATDDPHWTGTIH